MSVLFIYSVSPLGPTVGAPGPPPVLLFLLEEKVFRNLTLRPIVYVVYTSLCVQGRQIFRQQTL